MRDRISIAFESKVLCPQFTREQNYSINLQYFIDRKHFSAILCNNSINFREWSMVVCRNSKEKVPFRLKIFCGFNYFYAYLRQFSIFTMWKKDYCINLSRGAPYFGLLFDCRSCYQFINGDRFVAVLHHARSKFVQWVKYSEKITFLKSVKLI